MKSEGRNLIVGTGVHSLGGPFPPSGRRSFGVSDFGNSEFGFLRSLYFRNRQQTRAVDLRLLRKITLCLLKEILREQDFEICVHLVGAREMTTLNETFLQHRGSTDVITFDHSQNAAAILSAEAIRTDELPTECRQRPLHGEVFISIDDAVKQARQFRTTWPAELVRYVIHGILHLKGFDDLKVADRKIMKRAENRLLGELSRRFALSQLHHQSKTTA